ncbi:retrovirus-related Pol polyprotein from transposon 297 [Trichonephila clavipes]|nr:retrovirus-related Pol polyprotein from transposon 297 [Trichonephila clavipes]
MSALDLRSGYFQMAVNPSDIVRTVFVTKNGTYAFRRMPFRLSGAAPNFQKAIDIILKPLIGKFVNVYMDDVIISSPSFTQHIKHLNEVFRLLHDTGLTFGPGGAGGAACKQKWVEVPSPDLNREDEEEFLGVPLTPPKRVTHFPRLEEGNVPINTSWYGMFLGISKRFGESWTARRYHSADSRPIRKADCVSKKNPLQNTEVNRREI